VVTIDTTQIEVRDLLDIAETGGMYKGLGDWRPRFGRFAVIK
jgi:hypothetical protein